MCINCAKEVCNSGVSRIVQQVTQEDLHRNIMEVAAFVMSADIELITIMRCTACDLTWRCLRLDVITKHEGHVDQPLRSVIR